MDKQSISLSSDWVRCKSKSRRGRFYMFNKKTGETDWCSESVNNIPMKTVSAKDVLKTPAQDRLKRLQRDIQKKKPTESTTEKKKGGRQAKKVDTSHIIKPQTSNVKKEPILKANTSEKTPSSTTNKSSLNAERRPVLSPSRDQSPNLLQNKKNDVPNKTDLEPNKTQINTEQMPVRKEDFKFVIPKRPVRPAVSGMNASESLVKRNKSELSTSSPQLTDIVLGASSEVASQSKATPESCDTNQSCSSKTNSSLSSGNNSPLMQTKKGNIHSSIDRLSVNTLYDINDNQKQLKDESQFSFVSKLKNFCSTLIKRTTKPNKRKLVEKDKEKQINLSVNSKPPFKPKKPEDKSVVRSVLQKNETGSIQKLLPDLPHKHPPIPVSSQSANTRLQRLRQSLQLQQTALSSTVNDSSSSSTLLSEHSHVSTSICSPCVNPSECEPMDWESISDESTKIMINLTTLSNMPSADSSTASEHYGTVNENLMRLAADKKHSKQWKTDHFYFIVDTNVFIENLTFVEELTTMKLCDTAGTLIYVPYCVLQELDKLKIRSPSESIKIRSSRAIKYLNKSFETKNQHIQAQTAADETKHLIKVTSPDDSILNCCLQIKKHIDNVLLLTEDINLQNKAMCNDILVSTKSDLISKHENLI